MRYLTIGILLLTNLTSRASETQDPNAEDEAASERVTELVRKLSGKSDRDAGGRLSWVILEGEGVDTEVIRALSKCRFMKNLDFGKRVPGDVDLSSLSNLTLLEDLRIRSPWLRDGDLSFLRRLESLTYLDLSETAITGTALGWLPSPERLQSVTLRQCRCVVDLGGLLVKATSLRSVYFSGTNLAGKALRGLSSAKNLKFAELGGTGADDELLALLPTHQLRVLDLKGTRVSNKGVAALANCPDLKVLDLSGTRVGDEGVSHLGELRELTFLDLSHTRVGDVGMQAVGHDLRLRELRLADTRVRDGGLVQFKNLVSLATLDLSGTGITDAGIGSLSAMSELVSLDISGTRTGGEPTLDTLRRLTSLHSLKAARTKIDDHGLRVISKIEKLHALDLSMSAVSDAGVKLLGGHGSLTTLYLTDTAVGDLGARALADCPELIYLGLGNTRITDNTLIRLKTHFLKFLDVSGTAITSRGILALIDMPVPEVRAIDVTNTEVALPKGFRPPTRTNGRLLLTVPYEEENENADNECRRFEPR
jgi:internalin A